MSAALTEAAKVIAAFLSDAGTEIDQVTLLAILSELTEPARKPTPLRRSAPGFGRSGTKAVVNPDYEAAKVFGTSAYRCLVSDTGPSPSGETFAAYLMQLVGRTNRSILPPFIEALAETAGPYRMGGNDLAEVAARLDHIRSALILQPEADESESFVVSDTYDGYDEIQGLVPPREELTEQELRKRAADYVSAISTAAPNPELLIEHIVAASQAWRAGRSLPQIVPSDEPAFSDTQAELCELRSPVPPLSEEQIAAIIARGKERPWLERVAADKRSPFEWIRDTYGEWIPGLLQKHLRTADRDLYSAFLTRVNREGRPSWLDVPSKKEARDRVTTDPEKRALLARARRLTRQGTHAFKMSR